MPFNHIVRIAIADENVTEAASARARVTANFENFRAPVASVGTTR